MSDMSGLPNSFGGTDVQIFNALGTTDWQTWRKPIGKTFAYILMVGAGSGGGGGMTGASGTARGGGGGGGSGTVTRCIAPLILLPDLLFCNIGLGGAGGVAAGAGVAAGQSYLAHFTAVSSSYHALLSSHSTVPGVGGAGTAAAGGAGGAGGAVVANTSTLQSLTVFNATVGCAGAAGGAHTGAVGTSVTLGVDIDFSGVERATSGGCGGGGTPVADTDFAGGANTIGTLKWFPAAAGGLAAGGNGNSGFLMLQPYYSSGGSGGGTNGAAGVGGVGGDGAIGSGGGGGGGGVTGGAGGRGGNGLIMIASW